MNDDRTGMSQQSEQLELGSSALRRILNGRAVRLTRSSDADADDLVQDTLERALRNLHRFQPGTNLHGWLTTIMNRLLIDQKRRDRRRRAVPLADLPSPDVRDTDCDDEDLEAALLMNIAGLDEALARLPRHFRAVLELHAREGMRYGEIARRLSLPISTVGTRIMRARRLMRSYAVRPAPTCSGSAPAPRNRRRCRRPGDGS